jgi:tRNA threonylcarbamoyladenosine biosynthesis protein TsaB
VKVLAVDTAAGGGTVALLDGETWIAEAGGHAADSPVRRLLPLIDELLTRAGLALSGMDLMAVTRGPGSFTGLRVGLATVQGLALATKVPVVAVSTLEALALQAATDLVVAPMIDARRGEVYSAVYQIRAGEITMLAPEAALSPRAAAQRIRGSCMLIGSGVPVYEKELTTVLGSRAVLAPPDRHALTAVSVGSLALRRIKEAVSAEELVPRYLRGADAKPGAGRKRPVGVDKPLPDC